MADKKPPQKDPLPPDKAPMKDPKIDVSVKPKEAKTKDERRSNNEYADKVRKRLGEDVKKAVEQAGNDAERRDSANPRKEQLDAAKKTADNASKQIDPNKIERVRVKVDGENVADNTPSEGPPPPAPKP